MCIRDRDYNTSSQYNASGSGWQSFTAEDDALLNSVSLTFRASGSTETRTLSIYEGSGTGGTLLTSVTVSFSYTSGNNWVQFPITDEVLLTKDSIYTMRLDERLGVMGYYGNLYGGGHSTSGADWAFDIVYSPTTAGFWVDRGVGVGINNYVFPNADGYATQVLQTDGSGQLGWYSLNEDNIVDDDGNTKVNVAESGGTNMIRFNVGGKEYFRMLAGRITLSNTGGSVFIGEDAGQNENLSNRRNVAIGQYAGSALTTGQQNAALGAHALRSVQTGSHNVAIGRAMSSTSIGTAVSRNIGIGHQSLLALNSDDNIAIG